MFAVYGVLLLTSFTVLFLWAYGQYRRAAPKPWTTWESTSNAVILTLISLLAFGLGFLAKALISLESNPISVVHVALIAAIIGTGFALGRAVRRRAAPHMTKRPADVGPAHSSVTPMPVANDRGPSDRPRPIRPTGRRAA